MDKTLKNRILAIALGAYLCSTLVSMAVMSIGAAILGAAVIAKWGTLSNTLNRLTDELRFKNTRTYFGLSVAIVFTILLSLAVSYFRPLEIAGNTTPVILGDEIRKFSKLWYFFLPILLSSTFRALSPVELRSCIRAWIITSFIISVVGFIEHFTGWPFHRIVATSPQFYHTQAFFGFHLSYASIMIFPLFAATDYLFSKLRPVLPKPFLAAAVLVGALSLFFTYSRTLWVALPVGFLTWIVLRQSRKAFVISAISTIAIIVVLGQSPTVRMRFIGEQAGITDRFYLWTTHVEFLKARPLTGVGWRRNSEMTALYFQNNYPNQPDKLVSHAHSNILEVLAGTGILGFIAWASWCTFIFYLLLKSMKRGPDELRFATGAITALVVFHLNGLTQVNFWEGKSIHQLMIAAGFALFWSTKNETVV